jgi:uncharacterized membrane protein YfcA
MVLAATAAFAGAFVQSASGFGFALLLSPALFAAADDPVEAVGALLVLGLALNLLVLLEGGRVDVRAVAPVLVAALPGLALGALLLSELSKSTLQVAVGIAVIGAAGWQLAHRRAGRERRAPPAWLAGLTSGVLTTSISVSGPPLVLWLEARGVGPTEFRATLAASFLALNLSGGLVLLAAEGGAAFDPGLMAPLLALVVAGYALGALAFRRLDAERFFGFVLGLVVATGCASVVAGLA